MPVLADFWTTYQWLRELRRFHDERMVAVYFKLPDDELVHVGRYAQPHQTITATAASVWVKNNPAGAQIVVPHDIAAKHIVRVVEPPQLVGWTEVPDAKQKLDCVCPGCLGRGDRNFMRKVRGAFARRLARVRAAEKAKATNATIALALAELDTPLEAARGRIAPDKLVKYARSDDAQIRRVATSLFGYFTAPQVEAILREQLGDKSVSVRRVATNALMKVIGLEKTVALTSLDEEEPIRECLEWIEVEHDRQKAERALARFRGHPNVALRKEIEAVAQKISREE